MKKDDFPQKRFIKVKIWRRYLTFSFFLSDLQYLMWHLNELPVSTFPLVMVIMWTATDDKTDLPNPGLQFIRCFKKQRECEWKRASGDPSTESGGFDKQVYIAESLLSTWNCLVLALLAAHLSPPCYLWFLFFFFAHFFFYLLRLIFLTEQLICFLRSSF